MVEQQAGRRADRGAGVRGAAVTPEQRWRMIAEAAYYQAERRGFGGDPVSDWLEAEAEIDRMLAGRAFEREKEELAAYARLREEVKRILEEARGTVNADTIRQAVDRAGRELRDVGGYAAGTVNKVLAALRKDLASTGEKMGSRAEAATERASDLFEIWKDRSSTFLAQAAKAVSDWLEGVGGRLERRTYRAGEMTYGGVLECTSCGERLVLDQPAHLPECPKCRGSEFRRI